MSRGRWVDEATIARVIAEVPGVRGRLRFSQLLEEALADLGNGDSGLRAMLLARLAGAVLDQVGDVSPPSFRSRRVQMICVVIRAGPIRVVKFASAAVPGVAIPAAAV